MAAVATAEAVWFSEPRRVEIRRERLPPVGPRDVRVRTVASGVSAGSELLVYRGEAPAALEPDLGTVAGSFGLPIKFGYASVGQVVETGTDVEGLTVGQMMFAHYPHQTEFVVPADLPLPLPDGLPAEIGVFTANLETAATVVLDAHPRLAEAVLVTGQGVVGLLVTMLLLRAGAAPIITVDAHPRRRAASIAAGAHHVLEAHAQLPTQIRDLTHGRGTDVAIEVSGNPTALQTCLDAAAFAGTVVVASWYGTRPVTADLGSAFHRRRIRVLGSQVSTLDPSLQPRWDRARRAALVMELLCELPLEALITHRFAFHDAARAYRLLDERPEEALQVVLGHV